MPCELITAPKQTGQLNQHRFDEHIRLHASHVPITDHLLGRKNIIALLHKLPLVHQCRCGMGRHVRRSSGPFCLSGCQHARVSERPAWEQELEMPTKTIYIITIISLFPSGRPTSSSIANPTSSSPRVMSYREQLPPRRRRTYPGPDSESRSYSVLLWKNHFFFISPC